MVGLAGPGAAASRSRVLLAVALVVSLTLTIAVVLFLRRGGQRTLEVGQGVELFLPDGAFADDPDSTVSTGESPAPPIPGMTSAVAVDVTVSKQPLKPITVRIPVPRESFADLPTAADQNVLVLTRHEDEQWRPLIGSLDRSRSMVSVTTDRLSWFDVLLPSRKGIQKVAGDLMNGFFGGAVFRASRPECPDEAVARRSGWSATSTETDVFLWCLGIKGDDAEVRMVLNRRYPEVVRHDKDRVELVKNTGGELPVALAQAASSALGGGEVTVSPGGTAIFRVALPEGKKVDLKADFDGFAQSLVQLQVAAETLMAITAKMPVVKSAAKALAAKDFMRASNSASCAKALVNLSSDTEDDARVGAVTSACLDTAGVASRLGEPLVKFLQVVILPVVALYVFGRTSASALKDLVTGKTSFTIKVTRQEPRTVKPPECSADPVSVALCRFVAAVIDGTTASLSVNEQAIARKVGNLPNTTWRLGECESVGDITLSCPVDFGSRNRSFDLQPVNGEFDVITGEYVLPAGETIRYEVVSADATG